MLTTWLEATSSFLVASSGGAIDPLIAGIGFCFLVAAILSVLFTRIGIPSIAAFLAAGIIIGPEFAQIVTHQESITTIADLGLVLLLFLIGLEIDLRKLLASGKTLITTGLLQFPLTVLFGWCVGWLAQRSGWAPLLGGYVPLYVGFTLATSSSLIVVKLFQEKFQLDTLVGRVCLGVLIFQDIWAIVVLALQPNFEHPELVPVLFNFVGIGLLAGVAYGFARFLLPVCFRWIAKTPELILVAATGWCFGIAFLGTQLQHVLGFVGLGGFPVKVSLEMGALIAGTSIATLPYSKEVVGKVGNVKDFFVTLFFVGLGMGIPRPESADVLLLALFLSVLAILARYLIFFPLMYYTGMDRRNAIGASTKLAQISEFCLVIAYLGQGLGHVTREFASSVIFAFVITALATPFLFEMGDRIHERLAGVLTRLGFAAPGARAEEGEAEAPLTLALLGFHRIASSLLWELESRHPALLRETLVVDFNVALHGEIAKKGVRVLYGDIANPATLEHAGLERAKIIVSSIPDDVLRGTTNLHLVQHLRALAPKAVIVANALSMSEVSALYRAGADWVLLPRVEAAEALCQAVAAAREGWMEAFREAMDARRGDLSTRREVMP
ncbi:cation:proton antiporter [bacterium]|nr:cation:proton antiporter [bacterium]